MAEGQEVWVFSERPGLLNELIGGAQALVEKSGGKVVALVLGQRSTAEQAARRGAEVLWLGDLPEGRLVDDYVRTIAGLVEERKPWGLLVGSTRQGKAVAGRLAARLGTAALTDVLEFLSADGGVQARHMIFGGGAVRVDRATGGPLLATVGAGVFGRQAGDAAQAQPGSISEVPFVEPPWQAKLKEKKQRPPASVNLAAARKVVCAGRGLAKQEDLGLVSELARCLGAEVACTRPLAEGLDWLPRERYIGISGAMIKPELYLGVGVSGQVQHMIGMNGARLVVAINKDENAPIFQNADYGIVGDLYQVVPEIIKVLKK